MFHPMESDGNQHMKDVEQEGLQERIRWVERRKESEKEWCNNIRSTYSTLRVPGI
jgi:hypothetical protein